MLEGEDALRPVEGGDSSAMTPECEVQEALFSLPSLCRVLLEAGRPRPGWRTRTRPGVGPQRDGPVLTDLHGLVEVLHVFGPDRCIDHTGKAAVGIASSRRDMGIVGVLLTRLISNGPTCRSRPAWSRCQTKYSRSALFSSA